MDEFRDIQASLCPIREGAIDARCGNDAHDDWRCGNDAHNNRRHGNDANDDCRGYGPCRDRDASDAFTYLCIPVFNQAFDDRQPLPVPIDADLPHFVLKIGDSGTTPTPSLTDPLC